MDLAAVAGLRFPEMSGNAGVRELVAVMREPAYLRLLGKCMGAGVGLGVVARRMPQAAVPLAFVAGMYVALEIAGWLEEEAERAKGPVIDATAEPELDFDLIPRDSELVEVIERPVVFHRPEDLLE